MDAKTIVEKAFRLRLAERIQIVEDIWDTIQEQSEDIALTKEQEEVLDRRPE